MPRSESFSQVAEYQIGQLFVLNSDWSVSQHNRLCQSRSTVKSELNAKFAITIHETIQWQNKSNFQKTKIFKTEY